MSGLLTYSPEDVTILLAGFMEMVGYVDGTFVGISKDIAPFSSTTTADGVIARRYINSQSYTLTLTLHSASPFNDILTKLWQIDEFTQMGKFPVIIKDQLGSSLFVATTCWIEGLPIMDFANSIGERVWVIKCAQAAINIGGNDGESGLIEDLLNTVASAAPLISSFL
jgi:hypothetical protein